MQVQVSGNAARKSPRLKVWAAIAALLLGGCATTAYLEQSISGEFNLLRHAQPIQTLLGDTQTPADLRVRLRQVLAIRDFASGELLLPDNGSYRRYTDVGRPYVVWNVFVAPELASTLMNWCFPVAGCVAYRGYFHQADAENFAGGMRAQGFDVYVGGVPAYSTLGYFDDPVLSTFIHYPETEIARLLFHELAHQVAYSRDDSMFNESFAVTVEREGMRRYLAGASPERVAAVAEAGARREDFAELVSVARQHLEAAYATAADDNARRAAKTRIVGELKQAYATLKNGKWHGYAGYDPWFAADVNNAKLGSIAVYTARVPAFEALLRRESGNLAAFYAEVKRLSKLAKTERDAEMDALAVSAPVTQTGE
jgi:predicted aminopeptidase